MRLLGAAFGVCLTLVYSDEDVADLLTKALAGVKFEKFRALIGMS